MLSVLQTAATPREGEPLKKWRSKMSAAPIACMLTGRDFKERLAWIADLNRKSLTKMERGDLQLTLTYDRRAASQVDELAERERVCCPFLSFDIESAFNGVKLRITAPEEAREMADEVFRPFTGEAESVAGCSCCGSAA